MEEHEAAKPLVAVTNLREFFHDSVQTALRKQRVDVDDHTEHYVVNILTMFARSEELYEARPKASASNPSPTCSPTPARHPRRSNATTRCAASATSRCSSPASSRRASRAS